MSYPAAQAKLHFGDRATEQALGVDSLVSGKFLLTYKNHP